MTELPFDPAQLGSSIIAIGILVWVLRWFMTKLERLLERIDQSVELNTRALLRLLERQDPRAASDLSRELRRVAGQDDEE